MIQSFDQLGRNVVLKDFPQRIVSLVPSQTELLHDLGLRWQVVGVTKFCIYPQDAKVLGTVIGGTKNLDLTAIEDLDPDLIIANKEENDRDQVLKLAENFPVWISDIKNLKDAISLIQELGKLLRVEKKSIPLVQDIQKARLEYSVRKKDFATRNAMYVIWNEPIMTAGGDTFISQMMKEAGFVNVLGEKSRYPVITEEQIKSLQPEVILLSSEPFPFKEKHKARFSRLCPESLVILVDGTYFSWYGSRIRSSFEYFRNLIQNL